MKTQVASLIASAIAQLQDQAVLPADISPTINIDRSRDKQHGDFACNIALALAKPAKKNPRELAELIRANLPKDDNVTQVDIAGPGFLNFFITDQAQQKIIAQVLEAGDQFGLSDIGAGKKVQVEFVSANPTGPLHVGHGRGAAYGSTVSNLLEAVGFDVHREYYVNDAGRQMDILATSVWLRYLGLCGEELTFPSNGYKGDYVTNNIASQLKETHSHGLIKTAAEVFTSDITADEPAGGDKELHIDDLIQRSKQLLDDNYAIVFDAALNAVLDDIKDDLKEFGMNYDEWFSEKSLSSQGDIDKSLNELQAAGYLYENEGALWFKSTEFGDDKDRVVKRDNGQTTYFASDIAYHRNKFERGFDQVINIWGADHHGYVPRVNAALQALGLDKNKLDVLLVQFAILYRGKERVQMSTRSGSFVTLRELRKEVGNDAARYFYVTRKSEQHMDFDLDLAKSQSKDNPVYYVQYAHARIFSIFEKLKSENQIWDKEEGLASLDQLDQSYELALAKRLEQYPEVIQRAAMQHEPHSLTQYLGDLAADFHSYYNASKMLVDDKVIRNARITLSAAVAQVLRNGLTIIGVSAPNKM